MVKTVAFADLHVPTPGFGAMGMSQSFGPAVDSESLETLAHAVELGCTFWDTAVAYGKGHNEQLLGEFFSRYKCRDKVFVASKCGFQCMDGGDGSVNNTPEHINEYIEGTRQRLGSYPDLYYLHRIDTNTPLEQSIKALDNLKQMGKTRYIGLSECSANTLRRACKIAHIDALQIEYSPWTVDHEENGLIDTAKELGVKVIAFSPLGRGMLTGRFKKVEDFFGPDDFRNSLPRYQGEALKQNLRIVEGFERIAAAKGATPGQIAIAWVIAQGAIPIPGTKNIKRLDENFAAGDVDLNEGDLAQIRKLIMDARPVGPRYNEAHSKLVGH